MTYQAPGATTQTTSRTRNKGGGGKKGGGKKGKPSYSKGNYGFGVSTYGVGPNNDQYTVANTKRPPIPPPASATQAPPKTGANLTAEDLAKIHLLGEKPPPGGIPYSAYANAGINPETFGINDPLASQHSVYDYNTGAPMSTMIMDNWTYGNGYWSNSGAHKELTPEEKEARRPKYDYAGNPLGPGGQVYSSGANWDGATASYNPPPGMFTPQGGIKDMQPNMYGGYGRPPMGGYGAPQIQSHMMDTDGRRGGYGVQPQIQTHLMFGANQPRSFGRPSFSSGGNYQMPTLSEDQWNNRITDMRYDPNRPTNYQDYLQQHQQMSGMMDKYAPMFGGMFGGQPRPRPQPLIQPAFPQFGGAMGGIGGRPRPLYGGRPKVFNGQPGYLYR